MSIVLVWSEPVLGTQSFPVLALMKWKDWDRGPRRTGPGPIRSIGPMRSLEPDLQALPENADFILPLFLRL